MPLINIPKKAPISLIMEMPFYWKHLEQELILWQTNGIDFKYPSYVQDIMGPMCFDYGFGPFQMGLHFRKTRRFRKNRCHCLSKF